MLVLTKDNHGGLLPIEEGGDNHSPLEGESQRPSPLDEGRCGGGSFLSQEILCLGSQEFLFHQSEFSPHRIAFGLTPSALRLPLKGGVKFGVLPLWGFFNAPSPVGFDPRTPLEGGCCRDRSRPVGQPRGGVVPTVGGGSSLLGRLRHRNDEQNPIHP